MSLRTQVMFIFSFLFITCISGGFAREPNYKELTLKGIAAAYNLEIDKATQIFNELIALDPGNPHGYVLQSVNYYYRMQFDEQEHDFEKQFRKYTSEATKLARRLLSNTKRRTDAMFYLGTTQMYLAAFHAGQGNWLRAYWFGKDGLKYLEKVIAADSTYYDACLGLGLYHYYADVMPRFLKTVTSVFGIEGDRMRGLRELRLAAERGIYSRAEALFFLTNIYVETEREYEQALVYSKRLIELYPKGFMLLHGEVLQRNGYHQQAIDYFNKVILEFDAARFPFFIIWSYYNLGNAYFELNEFDRTISYCGQALRLLPTSAKNLKWVAALCNLKIGESYDLMEERSQSRIFYRKVEKSGHKLSYEIARERLKTPLSQPRIELLKGQNLAKSRQFEKAIAVYKQILTDISSNPDAASSKRVPEIHHNLGKAYYAKEEYTNAISEFNKVLAHKDIQPEWLKPWTHYYLGNCYRKKRAHKAAKTEFEIAYKFDDSYLRLEIDKLRDQFD